MRSIKYLLLVAAACGICLRATSAPSSTPSSSSTHTNSPLGIGFLWTAQSEQVANRLNSDKDFVDLILGPGNLSVFKKVAPPVRVSCLALSLQKNQDRPFLGLTEMIELLRKNNIPSERVLLAYNPERHPGTPSSEVDDLLGSARRAAELARSYGAPLIIGPGLKEMMGREQLYPDLAKCCDIWLVQSQRLQLDEATRRPVEVKVYREKVKQIVDRLRQGNPKVRIFVQLVTTAERGTVVQSAEQIAAFARSIEDLVDAVRIYGAPGDRLKQIIEQLRGPPALPAKTTSAK